MRILAVLFFLLPSLSFADPMMCADGTLKVALCDSSAPLSATNPVQQILVCQQPSSGYAIQTAQLTQAGATAVSAPQPANAQRLNDSQVQYASLNNDTALVLNGDRQSGIIHSCVSVSGNQSSCVSNFAICQ